MTTTRLTPAQRRALEALAKGNRGLLICSVYDFDSYLVTQECAWVHPGVVQSLKKRGYIAPDVGTEPTGWHYHRITDAGRAALESSDQ
jgi:hypothetical protein